MRAGRLCLPTIEVGARGYVAYSTESCFRQLGMQKRTVNSLCKSLSRVVARCSYAIYLSRNNKAWDKNGNCLQKQIALQKRAGAESSPLPGPRSDHC